MSTASKPQKTPCPKCGNPLRLAGLPVGEQVRCPKCDAAITIGGPGATAKKPAAKPAASSSSNTAQAKTAAGKTAPAKPAAGQPAPKTTVVDPTAAPIKVVAVHPFSERQPGELPIARPASTVDEFEDDDSAYEPEIPLIPSTIVPQEPIVDANLGNFLEQRREVRVSGDDAPQAVRPAEPPTDASDMYLDSARRRGLVRNFITPDPPRWTFLSGVFGYPWRGASLSRWAAMSFGLSISVTLCIKTVELLSTWDGAMAGLLTIVIAIAISLLTSTFVTTACQVAVQDTADGHDLPQDSTMPDWDQWLMTTLSWLMLGGASAAIGYPLSLYLGPDGFLIFLWVLFPILLLGSMESGSVVMPVSGPVLRSLLFCIHGWFMFYLLATLLLVLAVTAAVSLYPEMPGLVMLFSGPVLAALLLIYSRLLGRLAWKISGATMAPIELDGPADQPPQGGGGKKKKKRRRPKLVLPDEIPPHLVDLPRAVEVPPVEPPPRAKLR